MSDREFKEPAANDIKPTDVLWSDLYLYPDCSELGEELTLHSWDFQQSRREGITKGFGCLIPFSSSENPITETQQLPHRQPPTKLSLLPPKSSPRRSHPARGSVAQRIKGVPVPGLTGPGRRWFQAWAAPLEPSRATQRSETWAGGHLLQGDSLARPQPALYGHAETLPLRGEERSRGSERWESSRDAGVGILEAREAHFIIPRGTLPISPAPCLKDIVRAGIPAPRRKGGSSPHCKRPEGKRTTGTSNQHPKMPPAPLRNLEKPLSSLCYPMRSNGGQGRRKNGTLYNAP